MAAQILKWIGIVTGSIVLIIILVAVFMGPSQRGD